MLCSQFVADIVEHLDEVIAGTATDKFSLYSAHDTTLMPWLAVRLCLSISKELLKFIFRPTEFGMVFGLLMRPLSAFNCIKVCFLKSVSRHTHSIKIIQTISLLKFTTTTGCWHFLVVAVLVLILISELSALKSLLPSLSSALVPTLITPLILEQTRQTTKYDNQTSFVYYYAVTKVSSFWALRRNGDHWNGWCSRN